MLGYLMTNSRFQSFVKFKLGLGVENVSNLNKSHVQTLWGESLQINLKLKSESKRSKSRQNVEIKTMLIDKQAKK